MKTAILATLGLGSLATGLGYAVSLPGIQDVAYLTALAEIGTVVTTVSATGRVEAVVAIDVSSQLSGQIEEVFVDFNDEVTKGQPLARLDRKGFEASVQEANANLAVAQANAQAKQVAVDRAVKAHQTAKAESKVYAAETASAQAGYHKAKRDLERKEAVRTKGHLSDSEVDSARAEYEGARADLEAARAAQGVHEAKIAEAESAIRQATAEARSAQEAIPQKEAVLSQAQVRLDRSVIRSPIDGVVIEREVEPGQTVAASLEAPTLFKIAQDLRYMQVHANVDEADIGKIQAGQPVNFTVDAFTRRNFAGSVQEVRKAPHVVQNVVTYTVVIATENPDLLLLPGMTVMAEITVRESGQSLTVPNAALRFSPTEGIAEGSGKEPQSSDSSAGGEPALVWTLTDSGEPAPVSLMIGETNGIVTEVTGGQLAAGRQVILGEVLPVHDSSLLGLKFGF